MDDSGIKKQNWDVKETELFLEILKELDMKKCLDGRKVRNNKLFKVAHRRMTAAGYHRSVDQLKFRWKLLKSAYYKCKREPDSPTPIKIQGWWRYEKTMIAIMESRHPLVGAGVNADRNDDATEDSDGEASMLHWPQPCPDSGAQNNSSTQNLDLIVGLVPRRRCSLCRSVTAVKHVPSVPSCVDGALGLLGGQLRATFTALCGRFAPVQQSCMLIQLCLGFTGCRLWCCCSYSCCCCKRISHFLESRFPCSGDLVCVTETKHVKRTNPSRTATTQ